MHRTPPAPGLAALFALVLLLANLALTWHHYDLAAHRGEHPCTVCAVASTLGHGLAHAPAAVSPAARAGDCPEYLVHDATPARVFRRRARAPPF